MVDLILSVAEKAVDKVLGLRTYPEPPENIPRPKVIAHRGAWDQNAPENSLAAFVKARDLGIWGIEFDVHFTKDGVPVVNHDPDLIRLHECESAIMDMTYDEIRQKAPGVPSLKEVLELKGLHFFLEIKAPLTQTQIETLAKHLEGFEPLNDYHLLALNPGLVREHVKLPKRAWMLVGQLSLGSLVKISAQRELGGVAGHYLGMNWILFHRLKAHGQKVGVGFIPNKNLFHREWARGVDFVFTNTAAQLSYK
jgi:glycerophosphoryl diester phosphodiesterase